MRDLQRDSWQNQFLKETEKNEWYAIITNCFPKDLLDTLSERTISLFQQQTEGPPPSCTPGHPGHDSRAGVGGAGSVMGAAAGNHNASFASTASAGVGSVGKNA